MPPRPSNLIELHGRDIEACTDVPAILALFRKLRYPVEERGVDVRLAEDELPGSLRDGVQARYPVALIGGVRSGEALLSVTLFELKHSARKSEMIRGIAQTWTRRFSGEHLLVFTNKGRSDQGTIEQLAFVNTRRLGEGAQVRIKLHKLLVQRSSPTRHDLDTLNHIALPPSGLSAEQVYLLQCEAFDVERVTNTFYREYAALFRTAQARIKLDNPAIEAFADPTRLHTFTQRLFGRLMFLYFLQKKGALNNDHQFVKGRYETAVLRGENFYRSVLEPLFFETLNRSRSDSQSRFGRVPYLNGGLFAPDEDDHVGAVEVADTLFATKDPAGLLYFLENRNFTIEEDTPLEVEVALDPEMLGKVFENLLEEAERGQSGTFYTPRPVVAFMCREALAAYLTREVQLSDEQLRWLLDEAETGEAVRGEDGQPLLHTHSLPRPLRERAERALEQVRVLDPAVGSGAFPLGMLALLVGVRRALFRVGGVSIEQQTPLVEGWKRNFIRDCLYGVDIRREAIEIARLRLWLSLVVDADPFEMEPLPNLDFKLMAGDSLIETISGIAIYPTRPVESKATQLSLVESETQRLIHHLRDLKDEFFQPSGGKLASTIKQEIMQTEREVVLEALRELEQQSQERLNHLSTSLVGVLSTSANRIHIETLRREIQTTQQAIADLEAGQSLPLFLYRLHFASVFEEKDGFDIVIANPPYVRHERIPQETLRVLKAAYPTVQHGMADLYVYFYARALELVREGGILAFISSNKFFRAGYGKGLRDLLTHQTQAQVVLDLGDAPVFDATTDPCVVLVVNSKPVQDHRYRALMASNQIDVEELNILLENTSQTLLQTQGVQPPTSSEGASTLLQKLIQIGTPLGNYTNNKMYRGVVTGLNDVFFIDQAVHDRLITEDPRSAEILKPLIVGTNVRRYKLHPQGLWLIFTRRGTDITQYPAIERYLSQFHRDLQPRQKGQEGPGRKPGSYKWFEIQDSIDYYREFEKPKIIYPIICMSSRFTIDRSGYYSNDKAFIIPIEDYYLLGVLNSKCCWSWIKEKCPGHGDPNHRGRFELRDEKMKDLPIPQPNAKQRARIEELARRLVEQGPDAPEAPVWEAEIDQIVYQMFDLTPEEIAEVERRAQLAPVRRKQRTAIEGEEEA